MFPTDDEETRERARSGDGFVETERD
jgi:hypothetical protein